MRFGAASDLKPWFMVTDPAHYRKRPFSDGAILCAQS